jgi:hypothetical protein
MPDTGAPVRGSLREELERCRAQFAKARQAARAAKPKVESPPRVIPPPAPVAPSPTVSRRAAEISEAAERIMGRSALSNMTQSVEDARRRVRTPRGAVTATPSRTPHAEGGDGSSVPLGSSLRESAERELELTQSRWFSPGPIRRMGEQFSPEEEAKATDKGREEDAHDEVHSSPRPSVVLERTNSRRESMSVAELSSTGDVELQTRLRTRIGLLERELRDCRQQHQEAMRDALQEVATVRQGLRDEEGERQRLAVSLERLRVELEDSETARREVLQRAAELSEKLASAKRELAERKERDEEERGLRAMQLEEMSRNAHKGVENELREARERLQAREAQLAECKERLLEVSQERSDAEAEITGLKQEQLSLTRKCDEDGLLVQRQMLEISRLRDELDECHQRLDESRSELGVVQRERDGAQEEVSRLSQVVTNGKLALDEAERVWKQEREGLLGEAERWRGACEAKETQLEEMSTLPASMAQLEKEVEWLQRDALKAAERECAQEEASRAVRQLQESLELQAVEFHEAVKSRRASTIEDMAETVKTPPAEDVSGDAEQLLRESVEGLTRVKELLVSVRREAYKRLAQARGGTASSAAKLETLQQERDNLKFELAQKEGQLGELESALEGSRAELENHKASSRRRMEELENKYDERVRELEGSLGEMRSRVQALEAIRQRMEALAKERQLAFAQAAKRMSVARPPSLPGGVTTPPNKRVSVASPSVRPTPPPALPPGMTAEQVAERIAQRKLHTDATSDAKSPQPKAQSPKPLTVASQPPTILPPVRAESSQPRMVKSPPPSRRPSDSTPKAERVLAAAPALTKPSPPQRPSRPHGPHPSKPAPPALAKPEQAPMSDALAERRPQDAGDREAEFFRKQREEKRAADAAAEEEKRLAREAMTEEEREATELEEADEAKRLQRREKAILSGAAAYRGAPRPTLGRGRGRGRGRGSE